MKFLNNVWLGAQYGIGIAIGMMALSFVTNCILGLISLVMAFIKLRHGLI